MTRDDDGDADDGIDPRAAAMSLLPTVDDRGGAARPQPLRPGPVARPATRYRLGEVLGQGGMGEVVSAHDAQLGRAVAIKRMLGAASPEAEARFLREAQVQGRLDHPAIVPVHELARDDAGRPYFVMKRLAGTTLASVLDLLARQDPETVRHYPVQRLLRAFADICLAIEFAHSRGVVHRDLKPANITLGEFGEVYVLDWGVSRVLSDPELIDEPGSAAEPARATLDSGGSMTVDGTVLGTPLYMAPEQLRGEPVDAKADVYALGCLLFELITGQRVHPTDTPRSIDDAPPSRPSQRVIDRDIAPELDAACARATSPAPAGRPTARELGEAVQRYLDGDRDLAARREHARDHLARAHDALALGERGDARATAMREAGMALALDPSAADAAAIVGRLMLEPPPVLPPEIDAELERVEQSIARTQTRMAAWSYMAYWCFAPVLLWIGRGDWRYATAAAGVTALAMVVTWLGSRRDGIHPLVMTASILLNALLVGLIARMFTPFLIAPGVAAVTVMVLGSNRRFGNVWIVCAIMITAILAPWLLEATGTWSGTMTITAGSQLVLSTPAVDIRSPQIEVGLITYVAVLIFAAGLVSRAIAGTQQALRRSLTIQAWHLRQLVPRSTSA